MNEFYEDEFYNDLMNIKYKNKGKGTTMMSIFSGSYDVFENEEEMKRMSPIILQIKTDRLNRLKSSGFIFNESRNEDWKYNEAWFITEEGEKYLKERGNGKNYTK